MGIAFAVYSTVAFTTAYNYCNSNNNNNNNNNNKYRKLHERECIS